MKTYIYANSQIIAQHTGDHEADRYFYLHDRLGSVRQLIDTSGNVKNRYTYDPFGEEFATECADTIENPFKFTAQFYDPEIDEYYLRARQYDPHISRFTSRDPIEGDFEDPLTLHKYLYCENDPINMTDPEGEDGGFVGSMYIEGERAVYAAGALGAAYTLVAAINMRYESIGLMTFGEAATTAALSVYRAIAGIVHPAHDLKSNVENIREAQEKLRQLKDQLKNTKGPKKKGPLEKAIKDLEKWLKGHLKKMKQRYPDWNGNIPE